MKALVVDPRPRVATALARSLEEQLIPAYWEPDVRVAVQRAQSPEVSVVILSHEPPLHDGVSLANLMRRSNVRAAIVLLAREVDAALLRAAFETGVDDLLRRPYDVDELVARVRRLALRSETATHEVLTCGAVRFDVTAKRTFVGEDEVRLTPREAHLLQALLLHRGQVLSRTQLISKVWGTTEVPYTNVVDVQILRLRKRLGEIGRELIHTVPGFGYRLGD